MDAIVAAQSCGDDQSHEFLIFRRDGSFQISIVIDVVETLDQVIVGLVDFRIQPRSGFKEAAGDFTFVGDLLFAVAVCGLFAFCGLGKTLAEEEERVM